MGDLGAVPDGGVLQLHKVAYLYLPAHMAVGADVGEGADGGPSLYGTLVELGGVDCDLLPDGAVADHAVGANLAPGADGGLPPENRTWE